MNMFLDIETTGLIPPRANWRNDYLQYPHVVSISWKIDNTLHHYILQDDHLIVPKKVSDIHGITTEMVRRSNTSPLYVYGLLANHLEFSNKVVGHNIYFDSSIIKANALRYWGESLLSKEIDAGLSKDKRVDTMKAGQKLMGGKWPKLSELHKHLFKVEHEDQHTASGDVLAVERCFNKLVKLKVISND